MSRRISALSKGMEQRLGLAQSFIGDPDLLLLDEPTSGLDPVGRGEVIGILLEMQRQGKTILFSSHNLSEVERLCSRIGILVGGRLRYLGPVQDFLNKWGVEDIDEAFKKEALCVVS
jgi:ABC-2 type transport system ATP-binding protein